MTTQRLLALVLCLGSGCGGESTSGSRDASQEPRSGTGLGDGAAPAELIRPGVLRIPMKPRDVHQLGLVLNVSGDGEVSALSEQTIPLAYGDGYPTELEVELYDSTIAGNGVYPTKDELELTSIVAADEGLDVELVSPYAFRLGVHDVGEYHFTLEGEWNLTDPKAPSAGSFSLDHVVKVQRVTGVDWRVCSSSPPYVLSGAGFNVGRLQVLGEDGAIFSPWNVEGGRGATVTVHASPDTELTTPNGIRELIAEGPEQSIEVRSEDFGGLGAFELVHPKRLDAMTTRFYLTAGWTRGNELVTGGSYVGSFDLGGTGLIDVTPTLFVNGAGVCSPTLDRIFELRSLTPDTCPVAVEPVCADACLGGQLGVGAELLAAGSCELVLEVPDASDGKGLTNVLSVGFSEVTR